MSQEHNFKTIKNQDGDVVRMKAAISNHKDVTLNCFNDKCYAHLSDVSKCFKQGGGFDLKKVKSITLNKEEVSTFIRISKKLPALMEKMQLTKPASDDTDSDSAEGSAPKRKGKKITKRKASSSDDSDSESTVTKQKVSTSKKQIKTKRTHPYKKPSQQKKTPPKPVDIDSDTDQISSD